MGFDPHRHRATGAGFARVAKQVSSWTSKAVLTAVILVAGLVFGREVLTWWGADSPRPEPARAADAGEGVGDPAEPHWLQFGDQSWSFTQQATSGTAKEALATLRASCRKTTREATVLTDAPGPAEEDFLRSIAGRRPAEEEAGQWQLYELDGAFPMVAGVRPPQSSRRVVTWGLAVPHGAGNWTAYAFHVAPPTGGSPQCLSEVALPPGATRTLAIGAAGSGGMLSFSGPSEVETWKQFFDSRLAERGWKAVGGWRQYGSNWHTHYEKDPAEPDWVMDIHFGPDAQGGQTGLVIVSPRAGPKPRK